MADVYQPKISWQALRQAASSEWSIVCTQSNFSFEQASEQAMSFAL